MTFEIFNRKVRDSTDLGVNEVSEMVGAAMKKYKFWLRERDQSLVRDCRTGRDFELLVNGEWVKTGRPYCIDDPKLWQPMEANDLYWHAVDFVIPDLNNDRLRWLSGAGGRLQRSAIGRRIVPPPHGGAARDMDWDYSERSRGAILSCLSSTKGGDLVALNEQAQIGYDRERERNAKVEQRANFFLGAAGLSTTLVLANASVLLGAGSGTLSTPWRQLSAGVFAIASICAILAGVRAMQAIMLTFDRILPTGVAPVLFRWEAVDESRGALAYASGLLVAQEREAWVANWKLDRLSEARRWFSGTVFGVVVVTGFVLAEVL